MNDVFPALHNHALRMLLQVTLFVLKTVVAHSLEVLHYRDPRVTTVTPESMAAKVRKGKQGLLELQACE